MELRQLRHLIAVATAGSFTAAAERLHLSQPGLTLSIRKLEREIGGALLYRNTPSKGTPPVTLTPLGTALLADVEGPLHELDAAVLRARHTAVDSRAPLRLGFATSTPPEHVRRAVRALRGLGAEVLPAHIPWRQEAESFRTNSVDFAFVTARAGQSFEGFDAEQVATYPLAVAVPPDHELASREAVTVQDLADVPVLDPGETSPEAADPFFDRGFWLCDNRLERSVAKQRGNSVEEMEAFIAAGYGVAIVAASISHRWRNVDAVTLPLVDADQAGVFLVRREDHRSRYPGCWAQLVAEFSEPYAA